MEQKRAIIADSSSDEEDVQRIKSNYLEQTIEQEEDELARWREQRLQKLERFSQDLNKPSAFSNPMFIADNPLSQKVIQFEMDDSSLNQSPISPKLVTDGDLTRGLSDLMVSPDRQDKARRAQKKCQKDRLHPDEPAQIMVEAHTRNASSDPAEQVWALTEQNTTLQGSQSLLDSATRDINYSSQLLENQIGHVQNQLQSMRAAIQNEDIESILSKPATCGRETPRSGKKAGFESGKKRQGQNKLLADLPLQMGERTVSKSREKGEVERENALLRKKLDSVTATEKNLSKKVDDLVGLQLAQRTEYEKMLLTMQQQIESLKEHRANSREVTREPRETRDARESARVGSRGRKAVPSIGKRKASESAEKPSKKTPEGLSARSTDRKAPPMKEDLNERAQLRAQVSLLEEKLIKLRKATDNAQVRKLKVELKMTKQENERERKNFKKCFDQLHADFERATIEREQAWREKIDQQEAEIARLAQAFEAELQAERERNLDIKVENELLRQKLGARDCQDLPRNIFQANNAFQSEKYR